MATVMKRAKMIATEIQERWEEMSKLTAVDPATLTMGQRARLRILVSCNADAGFDLARLVAQLPTEKP